MEEPAAIPIPRDPGGILAYNIQNLASHTVGGGRYADWYEVGSVRSRVRSVGPPPKSTWQKFKDAFRSVVAWVFSNVGICVLVVAYLLVGAVCFQQIEAPEEMKIRFYVGAYRNDTVKRLWRVTERFNTLHPSNWSSDVSEIIREFQARIIEEASNGYDGSDIPKYKWTFSGSLLYSITVITTIGYGHIAPVTPVGKLMTIFYAIIGMPLFLLYLSNIGDIMATSFKWTYSRLCKCQRGSRSNRSAAPLGGGILKNSDNYRIKFLPSQIHAEMFKTAALSEESTSSNLSGVGKGQLPIGQPEVELAASEYSIGADDIQDEEEEDDDISGNMDGGGGRGGTGPPSLDTVTVPISLCLTVMVSYVCGGAVLFGEWEGWGFLDGSYFCFITLSTIGFGDIVPGDSVSNQVDDHHLTGGVASARAGLAEVNVQFVLCSLYILLGMAVIAMCFSLMQEKVVQGVRSLGRKIGIVKDD